MATGKLVKSPIAVEYRKYASDAISYLTLIWIFSLQG